MLIFKKYIVEIICVSFFIALMLHFAPIAFGATVDYANPEPNWKIELSEKLYEAYAQFEIETYNDRDHDFTDMDCAEMSKKLEIEIDLILFQYRNELLKESDMNIYYDEYQADLMEGKQD